MFRASFSGCSGLSGDSVKIKGEFLYKLYPELQDASIAGMCYGATGLNDYADIPAYWKRRV